MAARARGEILTLLIALLALARKFIILDVKETSGAQLLGLAAVTLVLGVTYWLIREGIGATLFRKEWVPR